MKYFKKKFFDSLLIFMKFLSFFHKNIVRLINCACYVIYCFLEATNTLLSSCNNIHLPFSLCSAIGFFLAKAIYPSAGLLIAKLHKTGKKIGSRKFYLVVFLLHVSKVPNVQCTITLYKHLQEEIMILI